MHLVDHSFHALLSHGASECSAIVSFFGRSEGCAGSRISSLPCGEQVLITSRGSLRGYGKRAAPNTPRASRLRVRVSGRGIGGLHVPLMSSRRRCGLHAAEADGRLRRLHGILWTVRPHAAADVRSAHGSNGVGEEALTSPLLGNPEAGNRPFSSDQET